MLSIGPITISGYGVALVTAFVIAWHVIAREHRRREEKPALAVEIVLTVCVGALLGSKLSYSALVGGPILIEGGHTFWGGLVGGSCAYGLWAWLRQEGFFRHLDPLGIAIAAGYSVGRTGCWAVGDDYGRPWDGPLAVRFPEGIPPTSAANMVRIFGVSPPPGSGPTTILAVHPTQLYEVGLGLGMFLLLWRFRSHSHDDGWLFGLYCLLAGVERFLIEFLRASSDRFAVGLSVAQVLALIVSGIGLLIMVERRGTLLHSQARNASAK